MKSIKTKLYIFIIIAVVAIAACSIIATFMINSQQVDEVYKHITTANAKNFAETLDGDYLDGLVDVLRSEEFQEIRDRSAEEDNNFIVQNYLEEQGLWEQYMLMQRSIDAYINNMSDIEYLYIVEHAKVDTEFDMFICDDSSNELYDCAGRYEEREEAFLGQDLVNIEPTISYSDEWGWLCSDYAPVYNSHGDIVALVGCDVSYVEMVNVRNQALMFSIIITAIIAIMTILISLVIISRYLIDPLNAISNGIKDFKPAGDTVEANVLNLNITRNDEIGAIYNNIRANQIRIIDYIKHITEMKEDLSEKDLKISKLSVASFKDALTSVGNKGAYLNKVKDLNSRDEDYAIVMVDINDLKRMNDLYGHKAGDWYIQGCCQAICKTFRHSPVYRIGGDEFVVVVENEDYPNRYHKLEELRTTFEIASRKETPHPWEQLSASVGMAENSSDDSSAELVFKRADKAMYEDKMKFKEVNGSYR